MDLGTLTGQSAKVISVIEQMKSNPDLLNEFKENPQEALNKMGIELNEDELGMVQKLESLRSLKDEAMGIFGKVKEFLGFKDGH